MILKKVQKNFSSKSPVFVVLRMALFVAAMSLFLSSVPMHASSVSEGKGNENVLNTTQDAFDLGVSALQKGDILLSTMYFANALANSPGNMDIIGQYVEVILNWAESRAGIDAMGYMNSLDNFLNNQVVLVSPSEIPGLLVMMEKVAAARENISERLTQENGLGKEKPLDIAKNVQTEEIQKLIEKARLSKSVSEHLDSLLHILGELPESGVEAETIETEYRVGLTVSSLIHQVRQFIKLGSEKKTELQLHFFNAAESSLQQAVGMSANLPGIYLAELEQLKTELDKSISLISRNRSKDALEAIEARFKKLNLPNYRMSSIKANSVLKGIAETMQDIGPYAQFITEPDHVVEFRKIMDSIQTAQVLWQEEQLARYNQWAIKNIERAVANIKKDDAFYKRTDKEKVAKNLRANFAEIDTRLLNFGAMQCFNEVFSYYYNMLDEEQKQELSKNIAFWSKQKLEDF